MPALTNDTVDKTRQPKATLDASGIEGNPETVAPPNPTGFGYLFPQLQNDQSNLLPEDKTTARNLVELGLTMKDPDAANPAFDSNIPSVYTYFGQFITHDITWEEGTPTKLDESVTPMSPADILKLVHNGRTGTLDLDSLYGPAFDGDGKPYQVPRNGDEMALEKAPPSQVYGTDLPRDVLPPYLARIGDRRNDENLITSQMHLAFLRAHNAIVKSGVPFDDARTLLRQHYQSIAITDFLNQVADPRIVSRVIDGAINIFNPPADAPSIPFEFSVAAFRFGHSMTRSVYNYNPSFNQARLYNLLLPKSGNYHHIAQDWIIDWRGFVPGGSNHARRIDTRLVEPLSELFGPDGKPLNIRLAVLDLLRGYLLRLPTGQAVAKELDLPVLSDSEIETVGAQVSADQEKILHDSGFSVRTPLWFYVLAEAAHYEQGLSLGPVGSTVVAAVLVGLVRASGDSFLSQKWTPTLGATLPELLKFAAV
jgi:hypothetical protein